MGFDLLAIPSEELLHASYLLPFLMILHSLAFWLFNIYQSIWIFISFRDFILLLKAVLIEVIFSLAFLFFIPFHIPRIVMPVYILFLVSILSSVRLLYRLFKDYRNRASFEGRKKVLIVGAGQAADLLLHEFGRNHILSNEYNIVALVDDDLAKQGYNIHGVRVIGNLNDIPKIIDEYSVDLVIIAIVSVKTDVVNKIVDYCKKAKIRSCIMPNFADLISGKITIDVLHEISVEDLLGRDQVKLDWVGISKIIGGKKIIVSGGGGSIGSELCRQIARLAPSLLIIVDNSEFNLYAIDKELREKFPRLYFVVFLIDITNPISIRNIMKQYHIDIVFHAAAYKHVPLLEYQTRSAIKNNILGTFNFAKASIDNNVATFVLISTDKAVNPVNVMGATKRAAEMICQNMNGQGSTCFITVRFGNVLNSTGSVIPLFKEQLASGKDLTVTHPEVQRYFMTIAEATQLVLQAAFLGKDGEIFVFDMGELIRIRDLAEQMIFLAGKKVGKDVNIKYIGLRPGEKLYEELFLSSEDLLPTAHVKIRKARYQVLDWEIISNYVDRFNQMFSTNESEEKFKELLLQMVPEYKSSSEYNHV
jgi:FlaA1/EpsC-like NDP-sugar epimerase